MGAAWNKDSLKSTGVNADTQSDRNNTHAGISEEGTELGKQEG